MTTPTPENLQSRLRSVVTRGRSRLGPRHDLFEFIYTRKIKTKKY